jgi:hypothetical protein
MKSLTVCAMLLFAASAYAAAPKPCEELKSEIAAKLEAKNVKSYSLEIVDKDKTAEGTVVGSCEGGTKKIVYQKKAAPPPASTTEAK